MSVFAVNVETYFHLLKVETNNNMLPATLLLIHDQLVTNQDFTTESDTGYLTASDQVDIRKNRVHMLQNKQKNHGGGKKCS